ncbi:MAG: flagellar basal body-associated FliL family protein [Treponemataceae bacterium]
MEKLVQVLKITVIVLTCIVLSLAAVALLKQPRQTERNVTRFESATSANDVQAFKKEKVLFGDIGTLRAKTKDNTVIVVSPYFEYNERDLAFQEELVKNKIAMRETILDFFKHKTKAELEKLGEEKIKTAILDSINDMLVMDKIEKLYFEKFIILE